MNQLIKEMRDTARELLSSGTVKTVIGWAKGSRWYLTPPVFLNNAEEVDRLYYDQFAVNNLTGYLLDYRDSDDKIAVFVKGCDSRGIIRLIQDNQINQDRVVVIGVPCGGMLDKAEVKDHRNPHVLSLLPKCLECRYPNPVYANITVGGVRVCHEPGEPTGNVLNLLTAKNVGSKKNERFSNVREIMAMDSEEKYEFWQKYHEMCLRCYACRNICPACSCRECIFDSDKKKWVNKAALPADNAFFSVTRTMHVAGRCVECGECERVCPVGIPVMALNRSVIQELYNLTMSYDAGIKLEMKPPLRQLKPISQTDGR